MPLVESTLRIEAPAAALFALSQDYGLRSAWDPFTRSLRFLGGATEAAPGVRVEVRSWHGLTMTAEYVTVDPPHVVAVRMTEGPRLLSLFAGSWRFRPLSAGATAVTFRYRFQTRWPRLAAVLDPIVGAVFRRDVRARLRGLKRAAESGGVLDRLPTPA